MATTQFCLTEAGTNLVGPNVSLLSNLDDFTTAFQTDVSLSSLQPPNCPVTLTVPDGATQIKLYDVASNVCTTITLSGNDLCNLYNLTITELQTTTISQIIIGDFVTSFGPVTDYLIYWYRNNETTPQYITGKGSLYPGYIATHPLTGSAALLAQSGEYSIKIAKMYINGINFSTLDTPEEGFVKVTTSCIPTVLVTVTALNCSNGTFTTTDLSLNGYSHKYEFNNASFDTTPQSLVTTFDLSFDTNYFAFAFQANSISDTLKIIFSGDSYSEPIVLENVQVGSQNVTDNTIPSAQFKSVSTSGLFRKILNLTQLNRTSQDYLVIEVTPNQTNNQTIWTLYMQCLTSINCTSCTDQFNNVPAKLLGSTITSNTILTSGVDCGVIQISTQTQACSTSVLDSEDLYKYFGVNFSSYRATTGVNPPFYITRVGTCDASYRNCSVFTSSFSTTTCGTNPNGTVNYSTTVTTVGSTKEICITVTFTSVANFNIFLSNFTTRLTSYRNTYSNYNDYLSDDFYVYLILKYPNGNGCGDQIPTAQIYLPLWLTYTTTVNSLTICFENIPSNYYDDFRTFYNFTVCDVNCSSGVLNQINLINNQINSYETTPLNATNSAGSYYSGAFNSIYGYQVNLPIEKTFSLGGNSNQINVYSNTTYMMSGNPLTLINTTPIKACDFESLGGWRVSTNQSYAVNSQLGFFNRDTPVYKVSAKNPQDPSYPDDFNIDGQTRNNGQNSGTYFSVYKKNEGIITQDNNFII